MNISQPDGEVALTPLVRFAVMMSFISFVIPFAGSIVSFVAAVIAKIRIQTQFAGNPRGLKMNSGTATIAQMISTFTIVCYGIFLWYAENHLWT